MSKEKDFLVHIPVELIKGEKDGEEQWTIRGIASTGDSDLQGESIDQEGLDISLLQAGRGLFNFDHQRGPENVVGQIEDAEFVMHEGKKALHVEGYLFKEQPKAQAFRNILKSLKKGSGPRVHMSIEGKILQRDHADNKRIKKARIDKVALTLDPVNPYTFAELCKSLNTPDAPEMLQTPEGGQVQILENKEEMILISKKQLEVLVETAQKAMSAGAGGADAPTSRTGGAAMQKESLEKNPKQMSYDKKKKKPNKAMVKSVIASLTKAFPSEDPLKLAEMAIEAFFENE
jgi:hypothetical protein